jgi:hypothetical protein
MRTLPFHWRILLLSATVFVAAAGDVSVVLCAPIAEVKAANATPAQCRAEPVAEERDSSAPLTISKETTFLEEPLDDDGYLDYFTAINHKFSEGVTTDNNAAVLFVRAGLGRTGFEPATQELFCERLGIDPLQDGENYYHHLAASDQHLVADLQKAMTKPWSVNEFPRLAVWFENSDEPLNLVVERTCRSLK